jgi:hypothetical protein
VAEIVIFFQWYLLITVITYRYGTDSSFVTVPLQPRVLVGRLWVVVCLSSARNSAVFGGKKQVTMFEMTKHVSGHVK